MQSLRRRIEKISVGKDDLTVCLILEPGQDYEGQDHMKLAWEKFRQTHDVVRRSIPGWFRENVKIFTIEIWRPSGAYDNRLLESAPDE